MSNQSQQSVNASGSDKGASQQSVTAPSSDADVEESQQSLTMPGLEQDDRVPSIDSISHPYNTKDKDFVNAKAFLLQASTLTGLNL